MSTLKVTNIQATGETASRAVSGVAAAWCNWNGTGTIAINDSNNVSSITDDGTGITVVNYTNDMARRLLCKWQQWVMDQPQAGVLQLCGLSIESHCGINKMACEHHGGT